MKKVLAMSLFAGLLASGVGVSLATAGAHDDFLTEGEIRKIDQEKGRVTLKHGPIKNLNMPGMTMMFQAVPASQLEDLEAGDKVKFRAVKDNGNFVVTNLEKVE
ncbi:copper-binding protein [Halopseudomonas sp.]|uniref:copper-binding protein n=1 Tax=Halopseudomonas sp. TaxID=2901191 RepID=UPI00356A6537